jgi:hypothetical protein
MRRTLTLSLACLCPILLQLGCSSSNGPDVADAYLDPTSPDNVLSNLERAYGDRDLDEYLSCLSEEFKFIFEGGFPGGDVPPWLYRSDEQQIHENMFEEEGMVLSVSLALATTEIETVSVFGNGGTPLPTVVYTVDAELDIEIQGGLILMARCPQEYRFRAIDGSREGEVHWEIVEWRDLEEEGRIAGRSSEDVTWGAIKLIFLEFLTQPCRRATPAEVMDQLEAAYVAMDLESYTDCLSYAFVFYPPEGYGGELPIVWYLDTELMIHTYMFSESPPNPSLAVESIELSLTTTDAIVIPGPDPQDPYDDTHVHTEAVELRVNLYAGLTYLATAPSEFRLQVDADDVGPYGEQLWEIVGWYDLCDAEQGASRNFRVEEACWTDIKALFGSQRR